MMLQYLQTEPLKSNSQKAKKWSDLTEEEKTEYGHYEGNYQYSVKGFIILILTLLLLA